jgi:hypothetical protein
MARRVKMTGGEVGTAVVVFRAVSRALERLRRFGGRSWWKDPVRVA